MKHFLPTIAFIGCLTFLVGCSSNGNGNGGGTSAPSYPWPKSTGTVKVNDPITVTGTYDGKMKTHDGAGLSGNCGQAEDMEPMFILKKGATVKNVIVKEAPDGFHVEGSNTKIQKVYFIQVCEDAITIGKHSDNTLIEDSAFKGAADKVIQNNSGDNATIRRNYFEVFKSAIRVKKGSFVKLVENNTFVNGSGAVVLDKGVKKPAMKDNGFYNIKYEVRQD
jgi:hypothetical protein